MPLDAVLFDFGHTIVDFYRTEESLLNAYGRIRDRLVLEVEGDHPSAEELIEGVAYAVDRAVDASYRQRRLEEVDVVSIFDRSFRELGYDLDGELVREMARLDHESFSMSLELRPATAETLERVRASGLKTGIVSNAHFLPEMMRRDLGDLGLAGYFDAAVYSSELGIRKPDPRIFRAVLGELDVAAERAAFVGDRVADDVKGAKAVGMRAVLTHEFRRDEGDPSEADAVIERLGDAVAIFEGWRQEA